MTGECERPAARGASIRCSARTLSCMAPLRDALSFQYLARRNGVFVDARSEPRGSRRADGAASSARTRDGEYARAFYYRMQAPDRSARTSCCASPSTNIRTTIRCALEFLRVVVRRAGATARRRRKSSKSPAKLDAPRRASSRVARHAAQSPSGARSPLADAQLAEIPWTDAGMPRRSSCASTGASASPTPEPASATATKRSR